MLAYLYSFPPVVGSILAGLAFLMLCIILWFIVRSGAK